MVFNILITILCLFSSIYYASLVGFRYSSNGEIDVNFKTPALVIELVFLIHLLLQFILEYKEEGDEPVNDPFKIANHYFYGTFAFDLVALIPFYMLSLKRNR
jgi:hypothetical protein